MLARLVVSMLSVGVVVLGAGAVCGQEYPNKPIRVVAPLAGGGGDFAARLIAQGLTGSLGQQVIVENRGGIAIVPAQIVAQAPPDGYTLLFYSSTIWLLPFMQDNVPYDPVRDFSPITLAVSSPAIIVVHPSLPVNSVKDLIALAKARPGKLKYASGATASNSHLTTELFKSMAGVDLLRIAYKGEGPAVIGLLSGDTQLMFAGIGSVSELAKSGKLRVLGVARAQPSALAPGVPTVAATGLPGFESLVVLGIFAPAKTPAAIIHRLNREIVRVLNTPEVKERLFKTGAEVIGNSPEEFAAMIKSDMVKWGKVTKEAGIRAN